MLETDWNDAIGAWFFNPEMQDHPVYLSLDDDTIEAVADRNGWALSDPVMDFEQSIRVHISPNADNPFRPWRMRTESWRKSSPETRSKFPPFVALLGATVLAACRMGSVERVAGLPPYYRPLRQILGLLPLNDGMPSGYDTHIPFFWVTMRKWLEGDLRGTLGLATAEAPPHYWPNIGYSVSQALLRGYDRARLTDFFLAVGAEPGTDLEPAELLLRLREWGSLGGRLSNRLKSLLAAPDMSEFLGRVLVRELVTWDGSRRDETGRRVLRLVVTLDAKRGNLGIAAIIPAGFPVTNVQIADARRTLDPADEYVDLPIEVTSEVLREGWSRSFPSVRLEYRARAVVPLLPDDRMNRWSSRERVEAGRAHYVLLETAWQNAIDFFFKARSPQAVISTRVKLPSGWIAYKDVTINSGLAEVPLPLLPLIPRAEVLPSLEGGLPLVPRRPIYLSGGPPDVDVPGLKGRTLSIELDGELVAEVDSKGCVLSLTGSDIQPGKHEVKIGSLNRRFEVLDHLRELPSEPVLAHHVTRHKMGWCADGPARPIDASKGIAISGCRIQFMNTDFSWHDSPPVMVKVSLETVALGPTHEVVDLEVLQPDWAAELGLPFNSFEIDPVIVRLNFEPCWIMRMFTHHYEVLHHGPVTHLEVDTSPRSQEWLDLEQRLLGMREDLTKLALAQIDAWKAYRASAV